MKGVTLANFRRYVKAGDDGIPIKSAINGRDLIIPDLPQIGLAGGIQHRLSHGLPSLSRSSLPPQGQLTRYQFASSHELICEQVRRGWHE